MNSDSDDESEVICAVCKVGDGDLVCCYLCGKSFHLKCHLPEIDQKPEGEWRCLFCKPRDEVFNDPETEGDTSCPVDSIQFRSKKEYMTACKFLCEVYMFPESAVTRSCFHNMYRVQHGAGESVCSLPSIRARLTLMMPKPYTHFLEMMDDLNTMFKQAYEHYQKSSDEYMFTQIFETKCVDLYELYLPQIETYAQPEPQDLIDTLITFFTQSSIAN